MTAAERWAQALAAWAIPPHILQAAPESPWGFPTALFVRRADAPPAQPTPSTLQALEALPAGGSVLDVGCGAGAASLPLAPRAGHLVGVDPSPDLLRAFRERGESRGTTVTTIEGTWPDVADRTPAADVVVCHHVAYNVPDLAPFVRQLTTHARRRVVLELPAQHPMTILNDLWLHFHHLQRPTAPTSDDAEAVLREEGLAPSRVTWDAPAVGWTSPFPDRGELVAWTRRRLCLPAERDAEIEAALAARLVNENDQVSFPPRPVVTLWWAGAAP